ncbi:MAG TPA: hypothetical protein VIV54_22355 [Burkholderiales bacterium]
MEFRVGQIIAKCAGCGGADFRKPEDEYSGPQMHYICSGCGQTTRYARLIMQIGREAMRQRRERLGTQRAPVERTLRATRPAR